MNEATLKLSVVVLVPVMILFRVAWESYPSVFACVLFWLAATTFNATRLVHCRRPLQIGGGVVLWAGGLSNALVTIANGGHMPVVAYAGMSPHKAGIVWVSALPTHYLLPFCDCLHGFSIGDVTMGVGIVATLVSWAASKLARSAPVAVAAPTWITR